MRITVIDGYQSVGTIPVDVRALGVDVYIGGCLKWLCGGPGAAFVWVDPEIRDRLRPGLTGWMAHEHPFAFEPRLDRRNDAWRFLHGTPSIPALYAARPGLEIINRIGIRPSDRSLNGRRPCCSSWPAHAVIACTSPRDPDRRGERSPSTSSTATRSPEV